MLKQSDSNRDGRVDFREFEDADKKGGPRGGHGGPGPRGPSPKTMFRQMDRNGDGMLSKDEARSAL
jgi:Ca2+-binding EF-hand superfamily protein